ncbi:aldehyde dehydrogenase family protein [Fluoribacter dumoffii]|uniref:Succinate-semialdehyde dehydrogenase [NADP(+)] n=1 Tax=Fluoribacter dumoffii TaxID=463 RepID=A0A377GDF3_9GAMM|nr:aldehyde dehydrogenase family protein [Fluoribacter dumoffii]KTC91150.1 aldehyde dehydrogenase [Fluoribacter dumoffii NY 23]MCW8387683.1 aldehyde dehydrogenase family protein [Fluoribacter dumoffii]MCW8416771.1 aldehyde dehydrogenase family protein [Fluoribacter dumoffii]MCW8455389.1 aldehyde dehydrogenase family protein [Fluoribacter dumoffii]MCW8460533.1 aldehyde dehydrogenase family protein [Fluoribacter dumoffii]
MKKTLQVVQAFDRALIKEIPVDDAHALERKLSTAESTFKKRAGWLKPHERMAILKQTAQLLRTDQERFAKLIAQEGGKPFTDAAVEVARAIDGLNDAAEELRHFAGKEIPMGLTPASESRWAFTVKEPIGVVAAISAFNHPLNLIVHQVAPAIAVGCPVIIKPATPTPLSCLELVKLLHKAGLGEEWCQTFITEDNSLAEHLATNERVAFLSFIGSAKVGWYLRSKLAPGTRCALEHGGAAPVIVDRSANLTKAAQALAKGGYYHAGQVCVSVQRIFVHKEIISSFMDEFVERVKSLRVGDPLLKDTEVGPLILPRETERVESWIEEAVTTGAKLFGGGRFSETTLIPAVLFHPSLDAKVSHLEIFGPVTCVYEYEKIEQAIHTANSLPFAFQASIFSEELAPALQAAEFLEASTVLINDHSAFRTDWMPFAGLKQSGYGVGGIPWTMKDMSQEKMIVLKKN